MRRESHGCLHGGGVVKEWPKFGLVVYASLLNSNLKKIEIRSNGDLKKKDEFLTIQNLIINTEEQ